MQMNTFVPYRTALSQKHRPPTGSPLRDKSLEACTVNVNTGASKDFRRHGARKRASEPSTRMGCGQSTTASKAPYARCQCLCVVCIVSSL